MGLPVEKELVGVELGLSIQGFHLRTYYMYVRLRPRIKSSIYHLPYNEADEHDQIFILKGRRTLSVLIWTTAVKRVSPFHGFGRRRFKVGKGRNI